MTRGRKPTEWTPMKIRFRPDVLAIINDYAATVPGITRVQAIHQLIRKGVQHASPDPDS